MRDLVMASLIVLDPQLKFDEKSSLNDGFQYEYELLLMLVVAYFFSSSLCESKRNRGYCHSTALRILAYCIYMEGEK